MEQKNRLAVKRGELQAVMAHEKFEVDKAKALGQEITTLHSKLMELHMAKKIEMREKGIPYSATCRGKRRRSGPCAVGTGQKGSGCKGANMQQGAITKPCKL
jgi:Spy/CpxP family protein refolding chaperone